MEEIWKPVSGLASHEVSNLGRCRGPRGELRGFVRLYATGKPKAVIVSPSRAFASKRLHRLVLEAFVGPCPDGLEGCHNDGDATNNKLENLRWDTPENNRADMVIHGTVPRPPTRYGDNHHMTTITDAQVADIRSKNFSRKDYGRLAEDYGVSRKTIRRIILMESRNVR